LFRNEIESENYCKLETVIDDIVDNRGKNPPYYAEAGIPIIDNFMIGNNQYIDNTLANRFIDDKLLNSFIRKRIKKDDLLITLVGAGIGNMGIVDDDNAVIIQNTIGLRFKENVTTEFMYYQLLMLKGEIINLNRSAAQPSVRVGNLVNLDVLVPDIKLQKKFSNFVKNIKKLKEIVNSDKNVVNKIFDIKFYEYMGE
jgi:type I restriction enzyme S subunit